MDGLASTASPGQALATFETEGDQQIRRLEAKLRLLPRDVGVVLFTIGTAGWAIPGPIPPGTPFVVAGAVFLSPRLIRPIGGFLRRRLPVFYRVLDNQVTRFQVDLERRYPGSTGPR